MTDHGAEHADPAWPHPGSAAARAADHWQPGPPLPDPGPVGGGAVVRGRVESVDGASPWADADAPAGVPATLPGVDGPHARPGWLDRARGPGPDGAA